jgi:hypothetical protein
MTPGSARSSPADSRTAGDGLPYLIPQEVLDDLTDDVWAEAIRLPVAGQQSFVASFRARRKSKALTYVLAFALGLHYVYLEEWRTQLLFWVTGGGLGIWGILDLWRIPRLVREKNRQVAKELLAGVAKRQSETADERRYTPQGRL